jgi:hypothetical protein
MPTEKEIKLVEQLLDKTRRHNLTWEPTAKSDEFVSTLGGRVSFTIGTWGSSEHVTMKDELDRLLLTVDSESIPLVSDLYVEARRMALRVDESLDDVLDQLGRMGG